MTPCYTFIVEHWGNGTTNGKKYCVYTQVKGLQCMYSSRICVIVHFSAVAKLKCVWETLEEMRFGFISGYYFGAKIRRKKLMVVKNSRLSRLWDFTGPTKVYRNGSGGPALAVGMLTTYTLRWPRSSSRTLSETLDYKYKRGSFRCIA